MERRELAKDVQSKYWQQQQGLDRPGTTGAPLAGLPALRKLNVSRTLVGDLSPLAEHIRRGAAVNWTLTASGDDGIYVYNCPLTNPPPEIVKQGNKAILDYFRERADGADHLQEAK